MKEDIDLYLIFHEAKGVHTYPAQRIDIVFNKKRHPREGGDP
ncbi:MAG: hypothetical protein PHW63_04435 [Alphaproteobacteria bacterium]|nr:hypothetical protein [Alphaproteobacteria bacterium]